MQASILSMFTILAGVTLAQTVEWTDIPNICRPACAYTINLSQGCAHNTNDEYLNCVCDKPQSPNWIPSCEACVATFWDSNNDVKSLLNSCSFTTTAWTGVTTATGSETATATGAASSTVDGTLSGNSASSTAAVGTTTSRSSTISSTSSATNSEFTGAAAPLATAGIGMAAVLMGFPVIF
ncbi:hypothetical protein DIS24_g3006 [Lasiodiplodia hormozganensis]|uniref:Uncharacterized protein n=1 Tax=Lasiodiplodia hormozganensis TaxID=869390 RepID=A0AA39Z085_9PEZI|nr:hypothetical protein DIS24_g3006 [Lasiodiplodia hormozganensis]